MDMRLLMLSLNLRLSSEEGSSTADERQTSTETGVRAPKGGEPVGKPINRRAKTNGNPIKKGNDRSTCFVRQGLGSVALKIMSFRDAPKPQEP